MVKELSDGVTETQILQKLWKNSHWRKLSMIMVWERYCNASPKPEFFLFSLFIFSFISRLIWVRLGWNFHRWFSIQKQVNWCTIDPFSLKFCTSQHSYPVPLILVRLCKCSRMIIHFCKMFSFDLTHSGQVPSLIMLSSVENEHISMKFECFICFKSLSGLWSPAFLRSRRKRVLPPRRSYPVQGSVMGGVSSLSPRSLPEALPRDVSP